jgi:aldose 1-epimerase
VDIYTLRNSSGAQARITNYGGIVQSLTMPDRAGQFADVVLGFDTLDGYLQDRYVKSCPNFGAIIGRYANRIGGAKFSINGHTYQLAANNGPNSLHGGIKGFHQALWTAKSADGPTGPQLILHYFSPDGEEGFPGNLDVTAIYTLTENNELNLAFSARTDQPTVVNLTHHSYFNLAGQGNGDILNHHLHLNASHTTPVDRTLIPTGELADVTGTPFDFRTPTAIGARINHPDKILQYGAGYDHNWVIDKPLGQFGLLARVIEPASDRVMEVWSTQPGVQFYCANFLDGSFTGKDGKVYHRRTAFCLEPQHFPDSPNQANFPSVVLRPGAEYHHTLTYKFSTR